MEAKIVKHGDEAAVPLTEDMLRLLGVREGDLVQIAFEGTRMIVTPSVRVTSDEAFDEAMHFVFDENAAVLKDLSK